MKKYKWADGARFTGDAEEVGRRLDALRREASGELKPEAVVKDAQDSESPLHEFFPWKDSEAAHQYRLEIARRLCRSIIVMVGPEESKRPFRAFVHVSDEDGRRYMSTAEVMSDGSLRALVLKRAWEELRDWKERYARYQELAEVFAALDKLDPKARPQRAAAKAARARA